MVCIASEYQSDIVDLLLAGSNAGLRMPEHGIHLNIVVYVEDYYFLLCLGATAVVCPSFHSYVQGYYLLQNVTVVGPSWKSNSWYIYMENYCFLQAASNKATHVHQWLITKRSLAEMHVQTMKPCW